MTVFLFFLFFHSSRAQNHKYLQFTGNSLVVIAILICLILANLQPTCFNGYTQCEFAEDFRFRGPNDALALLLVDLSFYRTRKINE